MRTRTILLLAIAAVVAVAGGVLFAGPPGAIAVVRPVRGPAVQAVYATGSVEASVTVPISARVTARLIDLNADEGSNVSRDQVLAQLEDTDLRAALQQLQVREDYARLSLDRAARLVRENAMSTDAYDRAAADYRAAQEARKAAAASLSYAQLLAPADGRIIRRDGEVGQIIPAGQPVLWIACCAPLRISAEVDEEDIPNVQPGQNVLIRADAFPGQVFRGTVTSITPKGDEVARSFRVRIGLDEATPLLIGMTAEANIILHEKTDALLVPTSAVTGDSVWVVEDGRLARRVIAPGARGPERTEATTGLDEQSLVVVNPERRFKEGQSARPRLSGGADGMP